ncbi:hypothetical protein Vadar_024647 [Vaccinium darrowii]|uniref:Uncharacterized protein n=1 Tax=Vaccinium darrowii TaxID=229202 RepID=A0ACB7XSV0_9ERIC|nr:hypothetical protein Vadar_024647 [Vaccinium darrowii]
MATEPPPTTEPLTTKPPTTEPPTTEPPTSEPPTTEPPTTEPRSTDLAGKNSKTRLFGGKAVQTLRCFAWFLVKHFRVDHHWLQEVPGHLITAAALTAATAYQNILSPPGGLWQDTKGYDQTAGTAILDSLHDPLFALYLNLNIAVLIASSWTIVLALSGLPTDNKLFLWLLIFSMYVSVACTTGVW